MLLVLPGLYIGGVGDVTGGRSLADAAISHVLTVDSEEPQDLSPSLHRKFLHLLDDSSADLLSYLPDCVQFIQGALEAGSCVLVHCHAGVSRSAAVIAAYMMSSMRITFSEAYRHLQDKKPDIKIHEEFVAQLMIYEEMGCAVDESSGGYKQYRLQKVTQKYPELKKMPREVFASDPHAPGQNKEGVYRCRKCSRPLFRAGSILDHALGDGFSQKRLVSVPASEQMKCTSFFVEPVQWMEDALLGVLDGQLLCPKCRAKLGSFSWSGDRCSCGRWVTPAFQVHKNRVDEVKNLTVPGR